MKKVLGAIICGGLFAGLIYLLGIYDVAAIGPLGTEVGFSHVNRFVHDLTGVNMFWYDITEFIGYAAIAICALFALAGLVQMIKRRSLLKVDHEILALGGLFIAVIACYVFFEKYVVNYRPIIMPNESAPEPSFPSSHTVLIMTVLVAVMIISDRYFGTGLGGLLRILCFLTVFVTIIGRLYCGVHWATDIAGGILLSATLLYLFSAVVSAGDKKKPGARLAGEFSEASRASKAAKSDTIDGYKPKH